MRKRSVLALGWLASGCVLIALALTLSLAPHLGSSSELVRLRNALLFDPRPALHDWTPANRPADFIVDTGPALPLFAAVMEEHGLRQPGDWSTALAIARHLLAGGRKHSEPVQADLVATYRAIVEQGRGYCGDYADVFTALANAAGLRSRAWAFSFDGFGGHGHIFNEVWDSERGTWVALDLQNNQLFLDASGQPLSAIGLRLALQQRVDPGLAPIHADVAPGYKYPHKLFDYYRRGLPEWYLWWGRAVQAQDRSLLVRAAAPFGRTAEQLAAMAAGVYPKLRVLHEPGNLQQREALANVRQRLLALMVMLPLTLVLVVAWLLARREPSPAPQQMGRA